MIDEEQYRALQAREKELEQELRTHDRARARLTTELHKAERAVREAASYIPVDDCAWLEQHGFADHDEFFSKEALLPEDGSSHSPYVQIGIERIPHCPPRYRCSVSRIEIAEDEPTPSYSSGYADSRGMHAVGSTPEEAIRELNRVREAMHERIDWIYNQAMAIVNDGYVGKAEKS